MTLSKWFIKLMKDEPTDKEIRKPNFSWVIDESKCLSLKEVKKLRDTCNKIRIFGLKNSKYTLIRNWFMVELGLNTGLRVEEMASLINRNLLIDGDRSSIVVIGKGNKKRAVLISPDFKKNCLT